MGVEGNCSGSRMDWEVRREEIVENSIREMGGKDGHQWEDDEDNSEDNSSLLMRTKMSGTVLSINMLLATTLTWVLFLFSVFREENKLRAHRQ